jgi:soluble lytic murein transglycosylase-like protein
MFAYLIFTGSALYAATAPSSLAFKIRDAAFRAGLDPRLVTAIVRIESKGNRMAISRKGAIGLMQVMPSFTDECEIHSPHHVTDNLMGACECLRKLLNRYRGNLKLALAAYNAGPSQVDRHKGVPPFAETRNYVARVLNLYRSLRDG